MEQQRCYSPEHVYCATAVSQAKVQGYCRGHKFSYMARLLPCARILLMCKDVSLCKDIHRVQGHCPCAKVLPWCQNNLHVQRYCPVQGYSLVAKVLPMCKDTARVQGYLLWCRDTDHVQRLSYCPTCKNAAIRKDTSRQQDTAHAGVSDIGSSIRVRYRRGTIILPTGKSTASAPSPLLAIRHTVCISQLPLQQFMHSTLHPNSMHRLCCSRRCTAPVPSPACRARS